MLTDGQTNRRTGMTNKIVALHNCMKAPKNIIDPNTIMQAAAHISVISFWSLSPQCFHFRTLDFQQRYKTIITQQHVV
jgi:hypothetical protein